MRSGTRQLSFRRKIYVSICAYIIIPLLFLFSCEILISFFIRLRYGVPGKSYGTYISDKELGVRLHPNAYNTGATYNNLGFRNINDIAVRKPIGSTRIYCSGGSTTYCQNLSNADTWSNLLQEKLRKLPKHQNDEVINSGVMSVPLAYEFKLAKRWIPILRPDYVVFYGTGFNEGGIELNMKKRGIDLDKLLKKREFGVYVLNDNMTSFWLRNSILLKLIDRIVKEALEKILVRKFLLSEKEYPGMSTPHPWTVENFDTIFNEYLLFLKQYNCTPIIVASTDSETDDNWYFNNYMRMFNKRAVMLGKAQGAIICDFASIVKDLPDKKDLFGPSKIHFTKQGAALLSDVLLETVKNIEKYK